MLYAIINSCRLYSCSIFVRLFQTTNDYMYAMYNDQPPEGHTSLNHGHTKGKETAPNPLNQHNTETVPHHNHWRKVFKMDCHYNCWRATQKLYRYHEQEQTTHRPTFNLHCHHKYRCTCTSQILYTITIHVYNWRRRTQNPNHHHNHGRTSQKPCRLHSHWRTAQILYCHKIKLMTYSTTISTFTVT